MSIDRNKISLIEEETDMIVSDGLSSRESKDSFASLSGDFIDPEKSRVLQELRRTQEEDLFPASWSKSQVALAQSMVERENSAVGVMSSIPMRCKGPNCVYKASCPLLKKGLAPEGFPCSLELNLILSMFEGFCVELGVNPDENFIDSALIRDLCNVFIQEARVSKVLADEHFVIDNVLTVDRDNNVVYKKEPHIAIFYSNKLHSKKLQILNSLLATREARVKTMKATRSPMSIGVNIQQAPGETMITMGNLLSNMNKKSAEERRKEYAYEIEEASFGNEIEEINLDSEEGDDGFGWDQKS